MQLIGWYSSIIAAEPYVISAVSTYIPLLLDEIARRNSSLFSDPSLPCITGERCTLKLLFWNIDPSSLPLYTISLSVLVQLLVVVSISGVIDRSNSTKQVYVLSAIVGGLATFFMGFVYNLGYLYAAILFLIANGCFGIVSVCGNSFIPRMAYQLNTERKIRFQTDLDRFHNAFRNQQELLESDQDFITRTSTSMSSMGAGLGYLAASLVHFITLALVFLHSSQEGKSKYALPLKFIGLWWVTGQACVYRWFRIPERLFTSELTYPQLIKYGWQEIIEAVHKVKNMRDITIFLLGWFLLSDAVTTINSTAILFAKNNLEMSTSGLAAIGSLSVLFAIIGALYIGPRWNRYKAMTRISLMGALIPVYGLLGFFVPYFGLKHSWEMYFVAAWHGLVLGALNAVARSLYSVLIPKSHEASFFALYSLTDKGSSVLGPMITGVLTNYMHDIRYGFYFLLVVMLLAAYVFSIIDFERGEEDAVRYSLNQPEQEVLE